MANLPPPLWTKDVDPFDVKFEHQDIAIGGKLIQATLNLSPLEQINFRTDDEYKRAIKNKMAHELARFMIEANLIEFTRLPQNHIGNDIIHARCYLAPNEQVKVLRTHYANSIQRR